MLSSRSLVAVALACVCLTAGASAQNFKVATKGAQSFNLKDERGRNQAAFFSKTPIEDITGTASGISGIVSLDPANVAKTIKATINVDVATMKTGIGMRDDHVKSDSWLNAEKYPSISFALKELKKIKQKAPNVLEGIASGEFTMHGTNVPMEIPVTLTYVVESEQSKKRAPGDLLSVRGKGKLQLSKFGIKNDVIGLKVADDIEFELNAVGSNAVK
jgi:polyisoprenoid-binding protein YceI